MSPLSNRASKNIWRELQADRQPKFVVCHYSGQIAQSITRTIGFYEYESYPPLPPCRRYCFVVEVDHPEEEEVALWLELYQSFAWVTEDEVNEERHGGSALRFHSHALRWIIQKAFRAVREERQGETSDEEKDTTGHSQSSA